MKVWSVVVVALLLVSIAGCVSPGAKEAEQLVYSANVDARGLCPQNINDSNSAQITLMLYDGLVKFDEDLSIIPWLAERWVVSEDELTWTFYLRDDAKFHNGKPVDAKAVKASFDRLLDTDLGLIRSPLFTMITEVTVVDDYVVAFSTDEPCGFMVATMAHTAAGIVDAEHAYALGKDAYMKDPIGSGPYKFSSWTEDEELVLVRNDDYWGDKPKIKNIVYRPIPEASSRVLALQSGETDVITQVPETDIVRLQEDENVEILSIWTAGQRGFRFNHAREIWNDPRVRRAVSHAIDRQAIAENLMMGQGNPSVGPLAPVTWGSHNFGVIEYNPELSKQLLADAGYPDGFTIHIVTTPRYAKGVEIAEAVQTYLRAVGIESTLEIVEWGIFSQTILGGLTPDELTCDFFIMGFATFTGDADWGLRPVYTTQPTNENNYGFYSNAEFDSLIFEAMKTTDQDKRLALYKRAQEIVYLEDPTAVWLFDTKYTIATRKGVNGLSMLPFSMVTFQKAWID